MTKRERQVLQICRFNRALTLQEMATCIGNKYQGGVLKIVHRLQDRGYLDAQRNLTDKGRQAI